MKNHIKKIFNREHYLRKVCSSYDSYIDGLDDILNKLSKKISKNKLKELIDKKLQIGLKKFDESQYVQAACELTVMSEFLDKDYIEFRYENKVTPPKDVDFTVVIDKCNYNIEVKCPVYNPENGGDDKILCLFTNRAPTLEIKDEMIEPIRSQLEKHGKTVVEGKNNDNKLKDFLESTHAKVENSPLSDVNILVVCCDNALDMHIWRGYMFGFSGLFTENSFIDHSKFNKVDYVLLTNIYNRHKNFYENSVISNHWKLSSSFNLLYPNRYSIRNENIIGYLDLDKMNKIFPNHNRKFEDYLSDKTDLPEGESYDAKEMLLGIAFYTDKFKKDGIYYFRSK
ncbi:MAG: hypothetical protein WAW36_07355 [Methylovulum miyakonense]|uniref:hypothetical protein n=1 Tax=Methylovulum miyakonense TaxID=645578 RepID=UPI003BB60657